jgi:hypothetical protein
VEGAVYLLCAATALAFGDFLLLGYRRSRARLLLWCGLCFLILSAENVLLFVDAIAMVGLRGLYFAGCGGAEIDLLRKRVSPCRASRGTYSATAWRSRSP